MIKLDIISGFLGAGKTTFIKKILQAYELGEEKIVVVINEFGDIGIDGQLIEQDGYELYEITKGCICCSLKEDFTSTLLKISENIAPDRVVLEPSGIFVIQEALELIKQERLMDKYKVNNIITIIDSIYFIKHHKNISLFMEKQIESASKLILSKVQYVEDNERQQMMRQLKQINKKAKIYKEPWKNYSHQDIIEMLDSKGIEVRSCDNIVDAKGSLKIKHNYEQYSIQTNRFFDRESVEELMKGVITGKYGKIIRSKGVLLGAPDNIEFQYIDGTYSVETFRKNIQSGKMTFIGESIEREALMNRI